VLWFIYMLAVFSLVAKLLWRLGAPHAAVIAVAAALQMSGFQSPSYAATQFAAYFVFFYFGYAASPLIFRIVGWAGDHVRISTAGLVVWAVGNGLLVYSPGFVVGPSGMRMGLAAFPPLHLALAVIGALALCVMGILLARLRFMGWLRWLGEHSLVVYVAFTIPMSIFRGLAMASGLLTATGPLSFAVLLVSIASPVILYLLVKRYGFGMFLFERPTWARITGNGKLASQRVTPS
jgi:uncharacterized membrane protein YcfT